MLPSVMGRAVMLCSFSSHYYIYKKRLPSQASASNTLIVFIMTTEFILVGRAVLG